MSLILNGERIPFLCLYSGLVGVKGALLNGKKMSFKLGKVKIPEVDGALLTEDDQRLLTESSQNIVVESATTRAVETTTATQTATATATQTAISTNSVKISQLTESESLGEENCFPVVSAKQTKKVTYDTIKTQLEDEVSADYEKARKKPSVNGVSLTGNKSFEDLGLEEVTNTEIEDIMKGDN